MKQQTWSQFISSLTTAELKRRWKLWQKVPSNWKLPYPPCHTQAAQIIRAELAIRGVKV